MRQNAQAWRTRARRLPAAAPLRLPGKVHTTGQMEQEAKGDSETSSPTQHKDFLVKQQPEQNPGGTAGLGIAFPCKSG